MLPWVSRRALSSSWSCDSVRVRASRIGRTRPSIACSRAKRSPFARSVCAARLSRASFKKVSVWLSNCRLASSPNTELRRSVASASGILALALEIRAAVELAPQPVPREPPDTEPDQQAGDRGRTDIKERPSQQRGHGAARTLKARSASGSSRGRRITRSAPQDRGSCFGRM